MGIISAVWHPRFWCFQLFVINSQTECTTIHFCLQAVKVVWLAKMVLMGILIIHELQLISYV